MKGKIIPINLGYVKSFLIKGNKWILVDTGMSISFSKIKRVLKKYQIKPHEIGLIILTHNHLDHVGGLKQLVSLTGAKVLMHELDANDLREGVSSVVKPATLYSKIFFKIFHHFKHIQYEADIVINDVYDLNAFGVNGQIIPTPGHTDGSISILFDNKDVLVSDLMNCNGRCAKYFYVINDKKAVEESLQKLINLGAKRFITSHSKECDVEYVKELLNR